jgi:calcium-binding protein CML
MYKRLPVKHNFRAADKDGSGTIDLNELKECFRQLQVSFSDDEVKAFHEESDMDSSKGVDFKEFIIVLALVYLLGTSKEGSSVYTCIHTFLSSSSI